MVGTYFRLSGQDTSVETERHVTSEVYLHKSTVMKSNLFSLPQIEQITFPSER